MKFKFLALLLALVMILSLAACGGDDDNAPSDSVSSDASTTPSDSGGNEDTYNILNVGSTQSGATGSMEMNGEMGTLNASSSTGYLCFEAPAMFNPSTGQIELVLAESYKWIDNYTLELKMKEGLTFSDGSVLDGYDVLASIQRYLDNNNNQSKASYGFYDMENSSVSDDGLTVTLKYLYEFGPAITYLSMVSVYSSDFLAANPSGTDIWLDGVAVPHSGPYDKVEVVLDSYERYVLRDDYWDTSANFEADEIFVYEYSDSTAMFIDFETGNLDLVIEISANDYSRILNGSVAGAEAILSNSNDTQKLVFDLSSEYLSDITVRKAFAHSIDVEAATIAGFGSLGKAATSILSSTMPYYLNVGAYDYDPDYSISLLEEAGYGSNVSLYWVCVNNTQQSTMAEGIQAFASAAGISINLDVQEQSAAIPLFMAGETDIILHQTSGGSPVLEAYQTTMGFLSDATFLAMRRLAGSVEDTALRDGMSTVDDSARKQAYQTFQQAMYDSYGAVAVTEYYYAHAYNAEKIDTIALMSPQHLNLRYITFK